MEIIELSTVFLTDLLKALNLDKSSDPSYKNIIIKNIRADSREVCVGDFFVGVPCSSVLENVKSAIENGAVVVLSTPEVLSAFKNIHSVVLVEYNNPRLSLSLLAAAFYKIQPEILMAVTGTNGKSSVVSMVQQLWVLLGKNAASFGTLGLEANVTLTNVQNLPSLTTYDSLSFFQLLKNLAESHIQHVIFEASSIGLDQFRIYGSQITVAGFTNFTQDHLDYHQNMEEYFQSKLKLFSEVLLTGGIAVLNANSPYFERLKGVASNRKINVLTYAANVVADIYATNIKIQEKNLVFDLHHDNKIYEKIILNLSGSFQVENVLCAIAMLIATGIELSKIIYVIPKINPIRGRMELVGQSNGAVYVDYAHTPDALERALRSLRQHTQKSVWVIFGCGGDRDKSKRSQMGKIAFNFADKIIVTDDNPRSEEPANIRQQILSECREKAYEIGDRREAIEYAIAHLEKGETLLIAGKGHEMGQIVGNVTYPFNDAEEAERVLARLRV